MTKAAAPPFWRNRNIWHITLMTVVRSQGEEKPYISFIYPKVLKLSLFNWNPISGIECSLSPGDDQSRSVPFLAKSQFLACNADGSWPFPRRGDILYHFIYSRVLKLSFSNLADVSSDVVTATKRKGGLGFLQQLFRLNVAITRPQDAFFVIADIQATFDLVSISLIFEVIS